MNTHEYPLTMDCQISRSFSLAKKVGCVACDFSSILPRDIWHFHFTGKERVFSIDNLRNFLIPCMEIPSHTWYRVAKKLTSKCYSVTRICRDGQFTLFQFWWMYRWASFASFPSFTFFSFFSFLPLNQSIVLLSNRQNKASREPYSKRSNCTKNIYTEFLKAILPISWKIIKN